MRGVGAGSGGDEAIAVLSDVTRLKTQQAQLETLARDRESMARRTRAILDSVLVGIVTVGPAGIEWMNRSAQRMFGGELADFLGEPIETVATAEPDHPFRRNRYLDELAEGEAATFECRVQARDGREFWVVGNAVATGRDDSARQLTYALLDIERRRQAEAAVSQAQASLRRVIEAAPLAIALLDARTLRLVQVNEVAAQVVGETPERLIGRTPEEVFGAARRRRAAARHGAARCGSHRGDDRASTGSSATASAQVWDARYLPLAAGARRAAGPAAAGRDRRHRAARRRRRRASRRRSRSARCWSRKCTTGSRTTCRAWPGCCSRSPSASPRSPAAIDEVVGQVQAIAQVYGLQVGDTGPLRWCERARGDHRLGAAHLRPDDPLPRRRRRARPTGRCPRPSRSRSR